MNIAMMFLFINAMLVSIFALIAVLFILRKEYLPIIKKLENKQSNSQIKGDK